MKLEFKQNLMFEKKKEELKMIERERKRGRKNSHVHLEAKFTTPTDPPMLQS